MNDDANLPPLPELRRDDLRPRPRELAEVVATRGRGGGVGVLEAFLHCYFEPEVVEEAAHFYTKIVPVAEGVDERTALLIWGKLIRIMEEAAGEPLSVVFRIPLAAGMFTVTGIAGGQSVPAHLDIDTALRGRLNVWARTISDHRTGHQTHYSGVKLVPTPKAIGIYPRFDHAVAFIEALDKLRCWEPGDGDERIISATKAALYAHLEKEYPGQFYTLNTFCRYYASNGHKTKELGFPIKWMEDRNSKRH